jgi:hypothetical protein
MESLAVGVLLIRLFRASRNGFETAQYFSGNPVKDRDAIITTFDKYACIGRRSLKGR